MSGFLRPDLQRTLHRWREVLAGIAVILLGLWLSGLGGPFWFALGLAVGLTGAALAVGGWMRARFDGGRGGPGVVQVVEGQIAYFGPETGGFLAIDEIQSLGIGLDPAGGVVWVIVSAQTRLEIPAGASGAADLFDAFASLPGADLSRIAAAAAREADRRGKTDLPVPVDGLSPVRVLWRRPDKAGPSTRLPRA